MKDHVTCNEKVLHTIENKLQERLTVNEIATMYGYSEEDFLRKFRKEMGISFVRYINRRRLIRTTELISKGNTIYEASSQFGWNSTSQFIKSYIREFGFSNLLSILLRKQI